MNDVAEGSAPMDACRLVSPSRLSQQRRQGMQLVALGVVSVVDNDDDTGLLQLSHGGTFVSPMQPLANKANRGLRCSWTRVAGSVAQRLLVGDYRIKVS